MKKYCGLDLSTAIIKVDGKRKLFGTLDLYVDLCIKAWCVSMIAENQANALRVLDITQNIIGKLQLFTE